MARKKNTQDYEDDYDYDYDDYDEPSGGRGSFAQVIKNNKLKFILIIAFSALFIFGLVLGLVLGLKSCNGVSSKNPVSENRRYDVTEYKTNTTVGFYGEVKGETERHKPVAETKNESAIFGNTDYPQYGKTLNSVIGTDADKQAARTKLIRESSYLTTVDTRNGGGGGYKWIDKDGFLYSGTTAEPVAVNYPDTDTHRQLYKHSASVGLYGGDVSDDEPGIIKTVKMRPRGYNGYGVTGVYAPAGEVVKIEMSEADMNATGGIQIHIGQALYNGKANNIWTAKNQMQRFPIILNTFNVDKTTSYFDEETKTYTAYVGSFIGGPLYIRNESVTFSATISGGVAYSHFILGYTTEKEFEQNAKSSAPYFDMEVWNYGVLHSGPKRQATKFTYDQLYDAAVLWDKVASVTTTGSRQGIVFLYDPFVAAGAAVAFPGQGSVNCPEGWMASSLNYNAIVNSGAWGNFHEYHHNFQGYGVGNGGEVTNNGMTLVSYSLFTKISENRGIGNYGGQGLSGWNSYTSATWALEETLKIARSGENPSNGNQGLALYATLLHNFGQDNYIKAKVAGGGQSYAAYMNAWQNVTHNNMYYYFNDILKGTGITNNANAEYPVFVPVSSVYQTGRSYTYDGEKRYFETMQPYVIPYGDTFTMDLRRYTAPGGQYSQGSIHLPERFNFEIVKISDPEHGKIAKTDTDGVYTYTPDGNLRSGKIYVTIRLIDTASSNKITTDDIDLVLEFKQSHEKNKNTLERTTYTYEASAMYTDAEEAFKKNFEGYKDVVYQDHFNPTQNANTDIWFRPNNDDYHNKFPNEPDKYFAHKNTIEVIDGKLQFSEDGKYRIFLRGRKNCAVYFSIDNKDYKLGAAVKNGSGSNFYTKDKNTYFDVEFDEGNVTVTVYVGSEEEQIYKGRTSGTNWIYAREVLIVDAETGVVPYIGLGAQAWTDLQFSMNTVYFNSAGKVIESMEDSNYAYTETQYNNNSGALVAVAVDRKGGTATEYFKIVSGKRVASTLEEVTELIQPRLIAPTSASYANAFRSSYEAIIEEFKTDYYYTRTYNYNYIDNITVPNEEKTVIETNYKPEGWGDKMPIENLTDGKNNTYIHTNWAVTEAKPLNLVFDFAEDRKVNRISFYCRNNGTMVESPKAFTVEGSTDGINYFPVATFTDAPRNGHYVTVDFDEVTMRYCRIVITATHQGSGSYYVVLGEVTFTRAFEVNGGNHVAPDNDMFHYGKGWHGAACDSIFGHVYVGNKNAEVSFEFEGTRLGIMSSAAYGRNFEVYIDGEKVNSIELKEDDSATAMTYLSEKLSSGKHSVKIKCTGEGNIDSFIFYNEAD